MAVGLFPTAVEAADNYQAELILYTDEGPQKPVAGLRIRLEPGWKTYWRMPGVAGVPPSFDWSGSDNVKLVTVLYPLPLRMADQGDEAIGYKDEVVFALIVERIDQSQPFKLKLALNFGICQDICLPAKALLTLDSATAPIDDAAQQWLSAIPVKQSDVVQSVSIVQDGKALFLDVKLAAPAIDIFVESTTFAYFGKPVPGPGPGQYRLPISNISDAHKLQGQELVLTLALQDRAVEQAVTLP